MVELIKQIMRESRASYCGKLTLIAMALNSDKNKCCDMDVEQISEATGCNSLYQYVVMRQLEDIGEMIKVTNVVKRSVFHKRIVTLGMTHEEVSRAIYEAFRVTR